MNNKIYLLTGAAVWRWKILKKMVMVIIALLSITGITITAICMPADRI